MSTRSFVGVYDDQGGWVARYCHHDGYPSGVGASLWKNYQEHFKGNLGAMVEILISEKVGWSSLSDCDLTLPPVWTEHIYKDGVTQLSWRSTPEMTRKAHDFQRGRGLTDEQLALRLTEFAPVSYTARGETEELLIRSTDDGFADTQWGYIFDLKNRGMDIYRRYNKPKLIESVYLDLAADVEPNWAAMEQGE